IHEDASDPARGGGSMSRPGRIAAILLAAGESARLGRPKQLLPFRGRTLLRHAAETALRSSCEEVFVVLGAAGESVRPQLDGLPVQVVLNAEWREGMGTSIRCGLRAALHEPRPLDGALMLLADQPLVTAEHLSRMVALFRCGRAPIVAAHYDGHPGAPVLFGDALFSELLRLEGGSGARQIVAASSSETLLFELPEAAVDVDVEAEYQALLER
ncbi:MAG: nucleotidyltransferase family protein, partial [Myxococcaceae bacterium]|nr:nucleotidyltransferase family protein [Myxococcaceae bacterium]